MKCKASILCCITVLVACLYIPSVAQADDIGNSTDFVLTRDKIVELATKNYMSVKQQELQIQLDTAQLHYVEEQRDDLDYAGRAVVQTRPTTVEELRAFVTDYDLMTDEEKQRVDAVLLIQAMINASINELVEAQVNAQYIAGVQQWSTQLDALEEEVKNGAYTLKMSQLEKQKLELLAQFYALQSYYEIVGLKLDLAAVEFEIETAESVVQDTKTLLRLGLSTIKEVEQAQQKLTQQQQNKKQLNKQLDEKLKAFKQTLGIKNEINLVLPEIDNMKAENSYDDAVIDIKKQIDYIKSDETVAYARAKLKQATSDNVLLAEYLNNVVLVETERKAMVEQWLGQQVELLDSEKEGITLNIQELEKQYETLTAKLADYETLLMNGSISKKDYELVTIELTRLKLTIEKSQLQQHIWQEKKRVAFLGVLQ